MPRYRAIDESLFRLHWAADMPIMRMAVIHGCSKNTITAVARRLELPQRRPGRRPSPYLESPTELGDGHWVRDQLVWRWQPAIPAPSPR